MSVDPAQQTAAMPFRVYGLEGQVKTQDHAISELNKTTARHSAAISAQAVTIAEHEQKLTGAHETVSEVKTDVALLAAAVVTLGEKVASSSNRIAWTFAIFALGLASSAIAVVLNAAP